jgi:RNA polymerase sigma-70 factor (ECF subfamily)
MTTAMNLCKAALSRKRLSIAGRGSVRAHDPPTADRLDVVTAVRQLAPRQRTAVILHYLGDLPLPEVARLMNVSEGTVKAHLAQARRRLRPLLEVSDA